MVFLQKLPTANWNNDNVDLLLSQAYYYKTLYHDSPSHLRDTAA